MLKNLQLPAQTLRWAGEEVFSAEEKGAIRNFLQFQNISTLFDSSRQLFYQIPVQVVHFHNPCVLCVMQNEPTSKTLCASSVVEWSFPWPLCFGCGALSSDKQHISLNQRSVTLATWASIARPLPVKTSNAQVFAHVNSNPWTSKTVGQTIGLSLLVRSYCYGIKTPEQKNMVPGPHKRLNTWREFKSFKVWLILTCGPNFLTKYVSELHPLWTSCHIPHNIDLKN